MINDPEQAHDPRVNWGQQCKFWSLGLGQLGSFLGIICVIKLTPNKRTKQNKWVFCSVRQRQMKRTEQNTTL